MLHWPWEGSHQCSRINSETQGAGEVSWARSQNIRHPALHLPLLACVCPGVTDILSLSLTYLTCEMGGIHPFSVSLASYLFLSPSLPCSCRAHTFQPQGLCTGCPLAVYTAHSLISLKALAQKLPPQGGLPDTLFKMTTQSLASVPPTQLFPFTSQYTI